MLNEAERHDLEWTPQRVRDFWDYHSSNPALVGQYFANSVGRSILRYVGKRIPIGTAVDLGCGGGHLMQFLMRRGADVYGVDQSPASIEKLKAKFADMNHFKGAAVRSQDLSDGIADTVFMIEVIEHLDDGALSESLNEARRLLKPGGHLVLTTPNEENLDASKIICPNCLAMFHQMQHVRSWSAGALAACVSDHGFVCQSSEGIALTEYSGVLDAIYRVLYYIRHRGNRPNLIYIGTKQS